MAGGLRTARRFSFLLTDKIRTGHGQDTDGTRTQNGRHTDKLRSYHGLKTDGPRASNGQETDGTRTDGGALGERALPRTCTIRVESWKLDFGLLEAAGGEIATLRLYHKTVRRFVV